MSTVHRWMFCSAYEALRRLSSLPTFNRKELLQKNLAFQFQGKTKQCTIQHWTCWSIQPPWRPRCHWAGWQPYPWMGQVCPLGPTDSYQLACQLTLSTDFTSLALVDTAACSIPLAFSTCFHPRQRRVATPPLAHAGRKSGKCCEAPSIQRSRANLPVGFV